MKKIYPRTGDTQTVYLNAVVKDPSIEVGDYTIYNDFGLSKWATIPSTMISCPTRCFSSGTMCFTIILSTMSG